ncbi:MAG: cytochrome c biogenesis protein ResB [Gemmataceae bacterium]|nr:cytochrome c biogenesis protein ResB [Gemmataceae bacterium]
MARKQALTAPIAVAEPPPVSAPPPPSPAPPISTPEVFRETPLGRALVRCFRLCASLQLAITLLGTFAFCLAVATLLESAYGARVAQELVYRAWWFSLLLVMLAGNVLCAALKKYPWRRHQTGFLVTHSGLLVLLSGGLLTALGGTEGMMLMIDTPDEAVHNRIGLTNTSHTLGFADRQRLQVFQLDPTVARDPKIEPLLVAIDRGTPPDPELSRHIRKQWALPFQPGNFAWYDDDQHARDLSWYLSLLHRFADPAPGFTRSLDGMATLAIRNYYPHTEQRPFREAPPGKGLPALKVRLASPVLARPVERWASAYVNTQPDPSPLSLEVMQLPHPGLLPEFVSPPDPKDMGPQGQLALLFDGKTYRVPVHRDRLQQPVPLEGTGRTVTLLDYAPDFFDKKSDEPAQPAVRFEVSGPHGKTEFTAFARLPNLADARGPEVGRLGVWYHFPDFRYGGSHRMGSLQFLQAGRKLYLRVYGKDGLREKGKEIDPADLTGEHKLPLGPMEMRFQVVEYLPRALHEESFVARHVPPGSEPSPRLRPAVRGTLTVNGHSEDFWVRQGGSPVFVEVDGEVFVVRYQSDTRALDFELTLKKAKRETDPGSNRPAAFQSEVVLAHGPRSRRTTEEHTISMNQPLRHGGYTFYQSNYEPVSDPRTHQLVMDSEGRAVSLSGLTVAHDPGLWLKYAGSALVVLGIAIMFYMRAYFFRRPAPV